MTLFIEGIAFPLGELNSNGWGVPFAEADNAIKSLNTSVVRICSRVDPHSCDYMGDPNTEIGHVVEAWQEDNTVFAKAQITDSIAVQKIEDGTWKTNWSIFAGMNEVDSGGWAHGITVESITIVNDPAWGQAKWDVVSASKSNNVDAKKIFTRTLSQFKIIASNNPQASNEGDNITTDLENKIEELKKQLAEKDTLISELNPKVESVEAMEAQVAELSASKKDLEEKLTEKSKLIASLEKDKAGSLTLDEAQKLVASALSDYEKKVMAEQERTAAYTLFASAREKIGLETNPEDFKTLAASDLKKLAEDLGSIKLSASGELKYPADSTAKNTACVGAYDAKTGEWK